MAKLPITRSLKTSHYHSVPNSERMDSLVAKVNVASGSTLLTHNARGASAGDATGTPPLGSRKFTPNDHRTRRRQLQDRKCPYLKTRIILALCSNVLRYLSCSSSSDRTRSSRSESHPLTTDWSASLLNASFRLNCTAVSNHEGSMDSCPYDRSPGVDESDSRPHGSCHAHSP